MTFPELSRGRLMTGVLGEGLEGKGTSPLSSWKARLDLVSKVRSGVLFLVLMLFSELVSKLRFMRLFG